MLQSMAKITLSKAKLAHKATKTPKTVTTFLFRYYYSAPQWNWFRGGFIRIYLPIDSQTTKERFLQVG
jgi:hypothetical protein